VDLAVLLKLLESLPEIRALMRCANRFKVPVGLCGGVLRNILVADPNASSDDTSLFDFVDPFGDIDLVFQGETADAVFLEALLAEIADADAHVWDPQTIEDRNRVATRPGVVAADKLIAWFKGLPGQDRAIEIEAVGADVQRILDGPLAVEVVPVTHQNLASEIGHVIKFARIQLNLVEGPRRLIEPFAALAARFRSPDATDQPKLTRRRSFQIELELAQLFLTVPQWNDARTVQRQLRDLVPENWIPEQSRLREILSFESLQDLRIGAAVYRPSARLPLQLDFFTSDRADDASSGMGQNRIPFAKLRLDNREERGCCPYVDFEDGIASVAWRHTNPEITRGDQRLEPSEYGLVSYPVSPGQTPDDARTRNRRIPMLGYLRRGRSIVVRIDPAYLKLATGRRFSTFVVGLVSIAVAEGENLPPVVPPPSVEPEAQGQDEKPETEPQKPSWIEEEEEVRRERVPVRVPVRA
jgi:hypothetical protein